MEKKELLQQKVQNETNFTNEVKTILSSSILRITDELRLMFSLDYSKRY